MLGIKDEDEIINEMQQREANRTAKIDQKYFLTKYETELQTRKKKKELLTSRLERENKYTFKPHINRDDSFEEVKKKSARNVTA